MGYQFLEECVTKAVSDPVDLNTAALTGARIKLDKGQKLAVHCHFGDSTAAVVTASFKQHNAASAGTSKAVSLRLPYFKKVGAATAFTKVAPDSAISSLDMAADLAAEPGIVVFEVLPEELDVNNGFAWFSIDFADATAAKLFSGIYIVENANKQAAYSLDV
jgi:hypothetical protein